MKLQIHNLTKKYGTKTAVDHMSFTVENGVYGLLGANGAGKTTLMRLICGIQRPTAGKITLDGQEVSGMGEEYCALLGYLPQNCAFYPDFTALDFLLYVCALKGIEAKNAGKRSRLLLREVGLEKEQKQKIKTFSGGMKQRLGIAQAMLNNPGILILDEPTAGLDPRERIRFRNLISAFSKNRIVILSTHIVSDIEFIAGEIMMMKNGRLLKTGCTGEITAEMLGKVWECTLPTVQAEKLAVKYPVSNMRNTEDGNTVLRIISPQKPLDGAKTVQPNLEDLYLNYFKEEKRDETAFEI
ncbi:ABC transporter ATP-binding protein [Blautia schinkii]|nr:ABC transporter ATP-binding protein [Blautia schinkii]